MANPKDFSARQIRTSQLIASGGIGGTKVGLVIYSASIASDLMGSTASNAKMMDDVGDDVYVFVSGSRGSKVARGDVGNGDQGVTLFGGDVVFSGTMYADRMVVEVDMQTTGSVLISGSMIVSESLTVRGYKQVPDEHGHSNKGNFVSIHLPKSHGSDRASVIAWDDLHARIWEQDNDFYISASNDIIISPGRGGLHGNLTVSSSYARIIAEGPANGPANRRYAIGTGDILLSASSDVISLGGRLVNSASNYVVFNDPSLANVTAQKDVFLYMSGGVSARQGSNRSVSLFDGDTVVSGVLFVSGAQGPGRTYSGGSISGSIHHTRDGLPYIIGHPYVTVTSASSGQLTIDANVAAKYGGWQDDGTVVRLINSADNVGIGTTNPKQKLHVSNQSSPAAIVISSDTHSSSVVFSQAATGGSTDAALVYESTTDRLVLVNSGSNDDIVFKVNDGGTLKEAMRIDASTERIGINMPTDLAAPAASLHVSSSASTVIRAESSRAGNLSAVVVRAKAAGSNTDIVAGNHHISLNMMSISGSNSNQYYALNKEPDGSASFTALQLGKKDKGVVQRPDFHILYYDDTLLYRPGLSLVSSSYGSQVMILSGTRNARGSDPDPRGFTDVSFFVSGSKGSITGSERGASAFGGDVLISGSLIASGGSTVIVGEMSVSEYIRHTGNSSTRLRFRNGSISIDADSKSYIKANGLESSINLNPDGNTLNTIISSAARNSLIVEGHSNSRVLILSGGGATSFDEAAAADVAFYISGSKGELSQHRHRSVSLFGGDTYVSGVLVVSGAQPPGRSYSGGSISGSIHRTATGKAYLAGKGYISITSASDGQVSFDATAAATASGWTDDGSVVRLVGSSDHVGIGTSEPKSALHVDGGAALPSTILVSANSKSSSIAFAEGAATIAAMVYEPSSNEMVLVHSGAGEAFRIKTTTHGSASPAATEVEALLIAQPSDGGHAQFFGGVAANDITFAVSGSKGAVRRHLVAGGRGVSSFGGDLVVSGVLYAGTSLPLPGTALFSSAFEVGSTTNPVARFANTVDSSAGGIVRLENTRGGSNGAADDFAGGLQYFAPDSAGNDTQYAKLTGKIISPTNGSEVGSLTIETATPLAHKGAPVFVRGDRVLILSGGGGTSADESAGADIAFYVSGALGSKSTSTRGTSLFGGDLVVSGALYVSEPGTGQDVIFYGEDASAIGLHWDADGGSHGKLTLGQDDHGVDFQVFGEDSNNYINWAQTTNTLSLYAAQGAINTKGNVVFDIANQGWDFTVNTNNKTGIFVDGSEDQVLILSGGGGTSQNEATNPDVNFYVSGTVHSRGTSNRGTALFGGDIVVSGSTHIHTDLVLHPSGANAHAVSLRKSAIVGTVNIVDSAVTLDTFHPARDGIRGARYIITGAPSQKIDRMLSEILVVPEYNDVGSNAPAVSETRLATGYNSAADSQYLNDSHVTVTVTMASGIVFVKIQGDSTYQAGNGGSKTMNISFERLAMKNL